MIPASMGASSIKAAMDFDSNMRACQDFLRQSDAWHSRPVNEPFDDPLQEAPVSYMINQAKAKYNLRACGDDVLFFDFVVVTKGEQVTVEEHCRIDSFVKLEGGRGLHIGAYTHVASYAHLNIGGGETVIGRYAAFASGCRIISGGNRPDGVSMSACAPADLQVLVPRLTFIDNFAAILAGATVLPGVTVGEGAVLAANALATKDLEPWAVYAGVPARKVAERPRPPAEWLELVRLGKIVPSHTGKWVHPADFSPLDAKIEAWAESNRLADESAYERRDGLASADEHRERGL